MIFDSFLFRNEFDILEIRLHELAPYVDQFVLVESGFTFQGKVKPLHFWNERERFEDFPITHVIARHTPHDDPWAVEEDQRNAIARGLEGAEPEDVVLLGDVDEIPRGEKIEEALERIDEGTPRVSFAQQLSFYHVNACSTTDKWLGTQAVTAGYLAARSPGKVRSLRFNEDAVIPGGGVHWCNLGDPEWLIEKIEAASHTEVNRDEYKDPEFLAECIAEHREMTGRDDLDFEVKDPDSIWLPEYLQENRERFAHLFAPTFAAHHPV